MVAGNDQGIFLCDAGTGKVRSKLQTEAGKYPSCAAFAPDGKTLGTATDLSDESGIAAGLVPPVGRRYRETAAEDFDPELLSRIK